MTFTRLVIASAFIGIFSAPCSAYNESPCRAIGGYCLQQYSSPACPNNAFVSGYCPTQANNIKCCTTYPYQESACSAIGGTCKEISTCSGQSYSGKCPTQGNDIKCCVSTPTSTGSGSCANVQFVSRSAWGARAPRSKSYVSGNREFLFVHHTEGGGCSSLSTCSSKVRGHQNYHMDTNGWSDIGYNFLIGGDGKVYEGRGYDVIGAHTENYNTRGYGVAFIGSFMTINPNAAAIQAFRDLTNCLVTKGKIRSTYGLYGHRQTKATSCPGNTLYATIQSWPNWRAGSP